MGLLRAGAHACGLLVLMIASACATQGVTTPTEAPTMDTVFAQVLEPRCTFSSCHSAPTVAAKLDLTRERACSALVNTASCLFPQRQLVVPSDPDESFLMHKLTGSGLSDLPTGSCSARSNAPMPFGASAIPQQEIDLVRSWIASGAPCDADADDNTGSKVARPRVASLTVDRAAPVAGQIITFTIGLDKPAPADGQVLDLETSTCVMSAPVQVTVPAGQSQVTFDAYVERPTSLFTLTARSGDSAKAIQLRVAGLEVTEALDDGDNHSQWVKLRNRSPFPLDLSGYRLQVGQASYGLVQVPLAGTVPADGCAVIGNPVDMLTGGGSVIYQRVDFNPALPAPGAHTTGYAVFDSSGEVVGGVRPPLDTMLVGAHNDGGLLGPDGQVAPPACGAVPHGSSARRTGDALCAAAVPQSAQCP